MILPDMTGKEFETIVKERSVEYKSASIAHISACGVQAARAKDEWMILQSLPDFEGVTSQGRQFIFDCKVSSQASFDLSKYRGETHGSKARQLKHMLERSKYGVPCFFFIHWNSREGKTFKEVAETFVFPVCYKVEFWQSFFAGETKSINRKDCEEFGERCAWSIYGQGRKPRPDVLPIVLNRIESGSWVKEFEVR